ncbi:MAG: PVC-type heme-binding CxxCH protein, partial [Verrucomicrobiota bacterium]
PLRPEESRKHFRVPDGFRIDLIAAEPLIADPSCVAWDERGRLFVTEIQGYNLEGHLDITELNKSGQLDRAIRRVRVGPEMKKRARQGQTGRLKWLRDTDGDGRMDDAVVWADDIPAAYGLVPARGGLIVTAAPHILFLADRDGDGIPEIRETLFTGFRLGEMERGINNPVWGPDNWIYAGQGWSGGSITGPGMKETVKLGRTDFRFKPDGSALEPVSGANHTFGMTFDDVGNRWLITTATHARYAAPLPHRYLIRNPHVATPKTTIDAANYRTTYPISQPHPWRRKRSEDERWVTFYGSHETRPNGNFTSACGQLIYRGGLFPAAYEGNHFSCDPQQNMIHRCLVQREGAGLRVRRPAEQASSEFLASTDGWYRPNNLRTGPDGALYIVDMYREIIEDYSAIPRDLQQQYGLLNGDDRGRVWRLAPENDPPTSIEMPTETSWVEQLSHRNHWWRETAQRLLVEGNDVRESGRVRNLVLDPKSPTGTRVQGLYVLKAFNVLDAPLLQAVIGDKDPALRLHTSSTCPSWHTAY